MNPRLVTGFCGAFLIFAALGAGCDPRTTTTAPTPEGLPLRSDLRNLVIGFELVADNLAEPTAIADAGDGSHRLFVAEKRGTIRVVADGEHLAEPFLDISRRVNTEGVGPGLLGLAFHPNYEENRLFFVHYTDNQGYSVIARFRASAADANRADPTSEVALLALAQNTASNFEHLGGALAFGPDGYLYVALGDGDQPGAPSSNAQDGASLKGSILRLDVDSGLPLLAYSIPPDNPFADEANTRDELWAKGLRNPWRISFDRLTGDLYIADVGEGGYEEINFQPAGSAGGENYGWPEMEGYACFAAGGDCAPELHAPPVSVYSHEDGCGIIGGYVYRGQSYRALYGAYLYSDLCSGGIRALARAANGNVVSTAFPVEIGFTTVTFGEDESGELYVADYVQGKLYRITLASSRSRPFLFFGDD